MSISDSSMHTAAPEAPVPGPEHWLDLAVTAARINVLEGGGPFGAVVVREGVLVAMGVNRVTRDLDPTAHAEVVAIRAACQALGSFDLSDCELYASCEPCPLCLTASLWSRVQKVSFAADRYDAARAGFDDEEFYLLLAKERSTWSLPVEQHRVSSAADPFLAWDEHAGRVHY